VDARNAKAQAKADKAYAKASRPWYKKKRFLIPGAILVIAVLASLGGGGDGDGDNAPAASRDTADQTEGDAEAATTGDDAEAATTGGDAESSLYPDRPDRQREDVEAAVGSSADVGGFSATVTELEYVPQLNDFEDEGYIVATVELTNTSDRSRPYNTFDWVMVTPNGQSLDPGFVSEDQLGSGDLLQGGNVSGRVFFEVPGDAPPTGFYYIIYKPDAFDAARAIWGREF
jgi:hypothetical protein